MTLLEALIAERERPMSRWSAPTSSPSEAARHRQALIEAITEGRKK
jgi:hypothetical protein